MRNQLNHLKIRRKVIAVATLLTIALAGPAASRLECQANFQITRYGPIATPYCEIAYVGSELRLEGVSRGSA